MCVCVCVFLFFFRQSKRRLINADSTKDARTVFITAKYKDRAFVDKPRSALCWCRRDSRSRSLSLSLARALSLSLSLSVLSAQCVAVVFILKK